MIPPYEDSFIYALTDPQKGSVQKQLSLLYLGMEMLEMNEKLGQTNAQDSLKDGGLQSADNGDRKSHPWWKLW